MIASALAGRAVAVAELQPGEPPWTDGQTIYVDASAPSRAKLEAIAVQASMIAAGSFDPDVVRRLVRHPRLARRYLAVEGHRALVANADLLPRALAPMGDREIASRSDSPAASLSIAAGRATVEDPATGFGVIRAAKVLAACSRASAQEDQATPQHVPRDSNAQGQEELDDDAIDDSDDPDLFTSPVGGGGFIGKWLKKMLSSKRKRSRSSGGGPPGADNPTHRTNSANRGAYAVSSLASTSSENVDDVEAKAAADGVKYPEWDVARKSYRPAWCTVREVEAKIKASATQEIDDAIGLRRPLVATWNGSASPPPPGSGRRHRHRRRSRSTRRAAGRVGPRRGRLPRQPAAPARPVGVAASRRVGLGGRARNGGPDGARTTARGGRQPDRCTCTTWVTGLPSTPITRRAGGR